MGDQATMAAGSGALSMALTGGSALAPLGPGGAAVGAIAGGIAGGVLGWFSGKSEENADAEAKRLAKKQEDMRKEADKMAKSAMRREEKQATESRSRAAKEGRDLPEPRMSGEDVMLAGNIAIGPGTPYDNYISSTYGRTPTSKS